MDFIDLFAPIGGKKGSRDRYSWFGIGSRRPAPAKPYRDPASGYTHGSPRHEFDQAANVHDTDEYRLVGRSQQVGEEGAFEDALDKIRNTGLPW